MGGALSENADSEHEQTIDATVHKAFNYLPTSCYVILVIFSQILTCKRPLLISSAGDNRMDTANPFLPW